MKFENYIKSFVVVLVLFISFTGVTITTKIKETAGMNTTISLVTLGTSAKAYCNEATYTGERNSGDCDGQANSPSSRCLASQDVENCIVPPMATFN